MTQHPARQTRHRRVHCRQYCSACVHRAGPVPRGGACSDLGRMSSFTQRLLAADIGGFHKAYELSNYTLAAAVPTAALTSKDGLLHKTADWALAVAIPVHMQITTNALVTDYVATRFRGPVRAAILGASLITYLGIMKVNLAGPGLTETVKTLWRKPAAS